MCLYVTNEAFNKSKHCADITLGSIYTMIPRLSAVTATKTVVQRLNQWYYIASFIPSQ